MNKLSNRKSEKAELTGKRHRPFAQNALANCTNNEQTVMI